MMQKLMIRAAFVMPLLTTACMRTASNVTIQPDFAKVSVRFVMPPEPGRIASEIVEPSARLAADASMTMLAEQPTGTPKFTNKSDLVHVALWGGGFDGEDVTHSSASLEPGAYTFAFLDPDTSTAVQGWINVNARDTEMIDFLQNWRNSIPEQKQWLAYDLEIQGKLKGGNTNAFTSFAHQLRAYDRLANQLDQAIVEEMRARAETTRNYDAFLQSAELLVLPGGEEFFSPTTKAAFSAEDLDRVRSGETMSKMLLVADYEDAQWKLRRVNNVYGELMRCKSVLTEEVERLERRKRYYTITDHLYHHDRAFVENEMRMQQTLSAIDRLNEQTADLRERRMAFAFISELVASNGAFRPLDMEQHDLMRERVVLEAKKHRLELLFDETDEQSHKRISIQRNRQQVMRAVEEIDEQLDQLAEARIALQTLRKTSNVIHRQGDYRLIASSFVDQDIPFRVREAIEREAIMTIRLEPTDSMFVPRKTRVAFSNSMQSQTMPHPMTDSQPVYESTRVTTTTQSGSSPHPRHVSESVNTTFTIGQMSTTRGSQPPAPSTSQTNQPYSSNNRNSKSSSYKSTTPSTGTTHQPTKFDQHGSTGYNNGWTSTTDRNAQLVSMDSYGDDEYAQKSTWTKSPCDCSWFAKLLVPPCWFESSNNNNDAQLTSFQDEGDNTRNQRQNQSKAGCDCNWFVKLLVPPCWLENN